MTISQSNKDEEIMEIVCRNLDNEKWRNRILDKLFLTYVKKDELKEVLEELKKQREDMNKRFEESDRRFKELIDSMNKRFEESNKRYEELREDMNKRFEESNKRYEELREDMNKRFEAVDKRFEAVDKRFEELIESMNKRFEAVDKRFEAVDKRFEELIESMNKRFEEQDNRIDRRFDKVFERLDELSSALGHDFEEFNSYWLQTFLEELGYPRIKIQKKVFYDGDYEVFPDRKEVEVDLFNEDPLVIGEVTAIVRRIDKVTTFLRKISFLEKKFGPAKYKIFITYAIKPEIRDEAIKLLEEAKVETIILRRGKKTRFID
ncbi:MAG: hypothetical protein ACTSYD_06690 [Candidatus Heimdallarchaeaceae archaeon]